MELSGFSLISKSDNKMRSRGRSAEDITDLVIQVMSVSPVTKDLNIVPRVCKFYIFITEFQL